MLSYNLKVLAINIYEQVLINFILHRDRDKHTENSLKENFKFFLTVSERKYNGRFFLPSFSVFLFLSLATIIIY